MAVYTDIQVPFVVNPFTMDIPLLVDAKAINKAIMNLLLTNKYEVPFHPWIEGSLESLLFEPIGSVTTHAITRAIRNTITKYEPRVGIDSLEVTTTPNESAYNIKISYTILTTNTPGEFTMTAERVR